MSDNPLRVAQILAGAERGGAENFFVRLVCGLNESPQLQQCAFIRDHQERIALLRNAGIETHGFRFGGRLDVLGVRRYQRALAKFDADIVMTWMGRASITTPPSRQYQLVCRLGHYYNLKYYRHADYWVGISKGICQHMIEGGMPPGRVVHIPNFADETPVDPLPRDSFDTPTDRPLVLAAGRLHENKGFDTLLHAMNDLPDAMLWLAGSGPEEKRLKLLCKRLGLNERVRFLGWQNNVTQLMRTADLFVCPSRHEGLGSIVMESWAHGCPIVATNSQGPGEAITDGVNGLITPVDDAGALAQAIQSVLTNPDLKQQLIDAGSEEYAAHYSQQVVVNRYLEFYTDIGRS